MAEIDIAAASGLAGSLGCATTVFAGGGAASFVAATVIGVEAVVAGAPEPRCMTNHAPTPTATITAPATIPIAAVCDFCGAVDADDGAPGGADCSASTVASAEPVMGRAAAVAMPAAAAAL